tara:strand:- start:14120 stop:14266 length:147 start_codon:yes stop_codon:yes gene_type:complete
LASRESLAESINSPAFSRTTTHSDSIRTRCTLLSGHASSGVMHKPAGF